MCGRSVAPLHAWVWQIFGLTWICASLYAHCNLPSKMGYKISLLHRPCIEANDLRHVEAQGSPLQCTHLHLTGTVCQECHKAAIRSECIQSINTLYCPQLSLIIVSKLAIESQEAPERLLDIVLQQKGVRLLSWQGLTCPLAHERQLSSSHLCVMCVIMAPSCHHPEHQRMQRQRVDDDKHAHRPAAACGKMLVLALRHSCHISRQCSAPKTALTQVYNMCPAELKS